jgi:hypothetical protein
MNDNRKRLLQTYKNLLEEMLREVESFSNSSEDYPKMGADIGRLRTLEDTLDSYGDMFVLMVMDERTPGERDDFATWFNAQTVSREMLSPYPPTGDRT